MGQYKIKRKTGLKRQTRPVEVEAESAAEGNTNWKYIFWLAVGMILIAFLHNYGVLR